MHLHSPMHRTTTQRVRLVRILLLVILTMMMGAGPAFAEMTVISAQPVFDPTRIDVEAKQTALGSNSTKLFEFVRDNIRYDAYQGVLRGARGTLVAQAGNSPDQALLLKALLESAGYEVRLARGTLDAEPAAQLIATMFLLAPSPEAPGDPDPESPVVLESLKSEITAQYRMIMDTLSDGAFELPARPLHSDQELIEQTRDHYWVQFRDEEQWVDLDPSMTGAETGKAYAPLAETLAELPDDLYHRFVLKVVLEEKKDGQFRTRELLNFEARAADLSADTLTLMHRNDNWTGPSSSLSQFAGGLGDAFNILAGAPENAKPVLFTADDYKLGELFDIEPPVRKPPGPFDFGGVAPVTAIAEWIELEFHSPDGSVDKSRRVIFDRIGFAKRSSGSHQYTEDALGNQHPTRATFSLSFYTGPLANAEVVSEADKAIDTETVAADKEYLAQEMARSLMGLSHSVSILSDRLVHPLSFDEGSAVFSYNSPRLIISTLRAGQGRVQLSLDLRRADYRARASSEALSNRAFQMQVLRGVVDGVVEAKVVDLLRSAEEPDSRITDLNYSTVHVFRQSGQQDIQPVLLANAATDSPPAFAAEANARILVDIGAGALVIAPSRSVTVAGNERTAWWRIDPASGTTIAVTEDGLHQGIHEYEYNVVRQEGGGYYIYMYAEGQAMSASGAVASWAGVQHVVASLIRVGFVALPGSLL